MKTSTKIYYVGIDVCKEKLDVHCQEWGKSRVFPNNLKGIRALLTTLRKLGKTLHLVCEASGGYEKALLQAAFGQEIRISAVNPRQVRDFARAKGQLAKTDAIDAQILTEYGEVFHPASRKAPSALLSKLSAAERRKNSLKRQKTREMNALEKATDSDVKADLKSAIAQLQRRIERFEKKILEHIGSDAEMSEKKRRMEEVKGIDPGTSSLLLAELPELGTITDKQASNLVGVAPLNRDSGKWRGKMSIHGGRGHVRRGLYMPALCAVNHNPILKKYYDRLIARNKAHHVALTAVMRKMVCLLNRLLADPDFKLS